MLNHALHHATVHISPPTSLGRCGACFCFLAAGLVGLATPVLAGGDAAFVAAACFVGDAVAGRAPVPPLPCDKQHACIFVRYIRRRQFAQRNITCAIGNARNNIVAEITLRSPVLLVPLSATLFLGARPPLQSPAEFEG